MHEADLIRSRDNPRVKEARALQKRRARQEAGRFLVEGVRLVADAWGAGIRPDLVFFDPVALPPGSPGHALVKAIAGAGVECLACTAAVFATLAETVTPQGIAAVLPLPGLPLPASASLLLILDGVRDPGNAGTLVRSAEAAGADGVIFGPQSVDPFNGKVVRAAMGAHMRLPIREMGGWSEIEALLPHGVTLYVAEMEAALAYDAVDWALPAALIIGGEAEGAGAAARAAATPVRIPMLGGAESLNAAMAGTVILFEAARQRRESAPGRM